MESDHRRDAQEAAARLASAVHTYRRFVEGLAHLEWDPQRYKVAADLFAYMEAEAKRLPAVRLQWLEVLISRFEFTHAWWEARHASKGMDCLAARKGRHLGALERLLSGCAESGGDAQS